MKLLESHIDLDDGYKIDGYFTDEEYKNEFDFDTRLDSDTTIYVRIAKVESENQENTIAGVEENEGRK